MTHLIIVIIIVISINIIIVHGGDCLISA